VRLADLSPGDYSKVGVPALRTEVNDNDGTVLGSSSTYTVELDKLQGWVDARFTATADRGLMGEAQDSATLCLRFEVRWTYNGEYVTHHHIECP
jgi:hypothetical protein